ncbi:hypothetical protein VMCG_06383 [Cytospora schulzeri]|uniref:Uncharacterized protein n=1 Tax=Cytospora schulzeri TaxID=448051 RepID=A0A423W884_9PEZI|nr:hypothetical protein VMCG_06383 [Valsa malicola]
MIGAKLILDDKAADAVPDTIKGATVKSRAHAIASTSGSTEPGFGRICSVNKSSALGFARSTPRWDNN